MRAVNDTHVTVVVNGSEALTVPLVGLLDPLQSGNLTDEDNSATLAPASHLHSGLQGPSAGQGRRLLQHGACCRLRPAIESGAALSPDLQLRPCPAALPAQPGSAVCACRCSPLQTHVAWRNWPWALGRCAARNGKQRCVCSAMAPLTGAWPCRRGGLGPASPVGQAWAAGQPCTEAPHRCRSPGACGRRQQRRRLQHRHHAADLPRCAR